MGRLGDLARTIRAMARGMHLCSLPATFREQFAISVPFLRAGLEAGERCLYVAHDNTVDVVRKELARQGMGPDDVTVVDVAETPMRAESIDAAQLLAAWRALAEQAVAGGHTGLRVVGEMTWALTADVDALVDYEQKAEALFENTPLHGLCQYNRARFPEATLRRAATGAHAALLREDGCWVQLRK